jgi:asparagine synthase (glutamine-hydrolysing)
MFARNLYYLREDGVVRIASEASLLARPSHAPDLVSLVRFIAGKPYERDRTLYDDIVPFKAGYLAEIDLATANISETRFWAPDPWRNDGLDEGDRAAALREVLSNAVRPRMRGKPVGVMASGGLDSSSAAATAARVAREQGWQPPHLFSFVSRGLPSDESVYQRALARHIGAPWHPIEAPADGYRPDCFPEMDLFHTSYAPNARLADEAVQSGVRILFTGDGSDELQPRTGLEIYSASDNHRWTDAFHFAGLVDAPFSAAHWAALGRAIVRSWIPKALLARRHRARKRRPPWLTSKATELLDEADGQIERELAEYCHPDPARNLVCELLTHGIPYTYSRPANQTFFARRGIELRYPFFDLRVVELLLAIPPLERVRFEQLKPLLRRAMGDDLPPLVRWRRFPSEYSRFFEKAVLSEADLWRALSRCERLAELGLVDPKVLRKALNEWGDEGLSRWDVDGTLTIEAWLERWR